MYNFRPRLGLQHDGDGNTCDGGRNIMAAMAATGPEALKWSTCSAAELQEFLA